MGARRILMAAVMALVGTLPVWGAVTPAAADAAPAYQLVDMGQLNGRSSKGLAVGDSGTVVGEAVNRLGSAGPTVVRPFRSTGSMVDMGRTDDLAAPGTATDIYEGASGRLIVGSTQVDLPGGLSGPLTATHGFVSDGTTMDTVGLPLFSLYAQAVNAGGEVVGHGTSPLVTGADSAAWYWDGEHWPTLLTLDGKHVGEAADINDEGLIVGSAPEQVSLPFGTTTTDVPVFSTDKATWKRLPLPAGYAGTATAVNNRGVVVGEAWWSWNGFMRTPFFATVSRRGTTFRFIPTPPHISATIADINEANVIVGTAWTWDQARATVFDLNNSPVDLNAITRGAQGWVLEHATGINERGQISGYGTRNGIQRAFRLDPVNTTVTVPRALTPLVGVVRNTLGI